MKRIKNGFTLIEMVVVVGILAALSVIIGISASQMVKNGAFEEYESTILEIFEAGKAYSNLSKVPSGCPVCNDNVNCEITLSCLVNKGLLDATYIGRDNPLKIGLGKYTSTTDNFTETDKIIVKYVSGEKLVQFVCYSGKIIQESDLKNKDFWIGAKCS